MQPPVYTPDQSQLPPYESAVFLQDTVQVKFEHTTPFKANGSRRWLSARAVLNNTQLSLAYKGLKSSKVLSLQYAQVGFAADYTKGRNPIRLRAEGMQLLFEFEKLFDAVSWLHALRLAIGISLPIELRDVPPEQYQSVRRNGPQNKHYYSPKLDEKDGSDDDSICSVDSSGSVGSGGSSSSSASSNSHSLLVKSDVPENVFIGLKEFGVITRRQTWEGCRWYIDKQWSLVEQNCVYSF